jgi:hypothetical protein
MIVLPGCGSSSSNPAAPTGPSQARITVTASATVSLSPRAGFTYRVTVPVTMVESAGLGANINYARLRMTLSGVEIERSEIGSADFVSQTGSNRLNANQSRSVTLNFDVNDPRSTAAILEINFTDDKSNTLTATYTITF